MIILKRANIDIIVITNNIEDPNPVLVKLYTGAIKTINDTKENQKSFTEVNFLFKKTTPNTIFNKNNKQKRPTRPKSW